MEVIFNVGENSSVHANLDGKEINLAPCFINGFNYCPIHLQLPKGHSFFGIQFQPIAINSLFKMPAREFANYAIDMNFVDTTFRSLWHQLKEQTSFHKRVTIISEWLKQKQINAQPRDELLNHFLCDPKEKATTVKEHAAALCYSPRHLSRKVYDLTGMNTEQLLLYKKYLHAVHLIHSSPLSLTEIAYKSEFSDQSHFIKSFKSFAQMTPGEYRKQKSNVPGHIYGNE